MRVLFRCVVNIILFALILFVIQTPVIAGLDSDHLNVQNNAIGHMIRFSLMLVPFLIAVWFCNLYSKRLGLSVDRLKCHMDKGKWQLTLVFATLNALALVIYFIWSFIKDNNVEVPSQIANRYHNPILFLIFSTTLVVLQPILEEYLCRGILLEKISNYNPLIALVFSAFIFSYAHFNGTIFNSQFISGLFYGVLYLKTKKLISPILVHSVHNLVVLLAILIMS